MCRPLPSLPRRLDLPDAAQLHDRVRLRRVRDRLDREYERPFDLAALARGIQMAPGHLTREFEDAYGLAPYAYLTLRRLDPTPARLAKTIRNREAPAVAADLALRT